MVYEVYPNYLSHHGVLGMKWGVRRYQNKGGSLIKKKKKSKLNKTEKNTLKAAGVLAGISILQTIGNYKIAQGGLDAMGYGDKIAISQVVTKGTVAAGKSAVIGALGYIGAHKVHDYVKNRPSDD